MTHSFRLHRGVLPLALTAMAALATFALPGCAGGPRETITYYAPQPASSAMRVTQSAGPANEAVFEFPQHQLRLMVVAQPSYDPPRIWVSVHLPEGKLMRVEEDQFLITPGDDTPARAVPVHYIRGTHLIAGEIVYRDYRPGADLIGATNPTYTRFWGKPTTFSRQYEIVALLGQTLAPTFTLQLPAITVDETPLNLPAITFTRQSGEFTVPVNSMHPW